MKTSKKSISLVVGMMVALLLPFIGSRIDHSKLNKIFHKERNPLKSKDLPDADSTILGI